MELTDKQLGMCKLDSSSAMKKVENKKWDTTTE